MEIGISVPRIRKRIFDRVIIPGLIPSKVSSVVSLGMNRPEWIKFVLSSVIQFQYDLESHSDTSKMIFDEDNGALIQAFKWKKTAKDTNLRSTAGYGIGFNQIESELLTSTYSVEYLVTQQLYDFLEKMADEHVEYCADKLHSIFKYSIPKKQLELKIRDILIKSEYGENDFFGLYSWMIKVILQQKRDDSAWFFSIINIYINISNDLLSVNNDQNLYKRMFSREIPGKISMELNKHEAALLLHEFLKDEKYKPITHSVILYYILTKKSHDNNDLDQVLKRSYSLLPNSNEIKKSLKEFYKKMIQLCEKYCRKNDLYKYEVFNEICSVEDIKNVAIFWEYNLICGDFEKTMRDYIDCQKEPPFEFNFNDRWREYRQENRRYKNLKSIIDDFLDFIAKSVSNNDYSYLLQSTNIEQVNMLAWAEEIHHVIDKKRNYKELVHSMLQYSESNSDVLKTVGDRIDVQKLPAVVNPMIARGAMYDWMRVLRKIEE